MTKRAYILAGLFVFIASLVFAQAPSTVKAYELYTEGEYALASKAIDQAITEKEGVGDPLAWQLRAIIYYELFAKIEGKNKLSESRVKSLSSALHSMELDENKEFYDQNVLILENISFTYYNDAVTELSNVDPNNPGFAESSFKEYIRLQRIAHPDSDLKQKEIEFYRAQATAFGSLYQMDPEGNLKFFDLTIESLQNVLQLDSLDYAAHYNLSVYYYNEGAFKIETMNSNIPLPDIIIIEKESIDLFKKALPHMLKAHDIKKREDTYKGLIGIYRSLSDVEKSDYYRLELEKFIENKSK